MRPPSATMLVLSRAIFVGVAMAATACGHAKRPPAAPPHPAIAEPRPAPLARDIVARAAGPFFGIRRSDGARLDDSAVLEALSEYDAVCVGEQHDEPSHHFLQIQVLKRLAERAPQSGRTLALGLEMVALSYQKTLDEYAAWRIDETTLLERTEWKERWGFDFSLYRPVVELARRAGVRLLALNAPKELTRAVAHDGVNGLKPEARGSLPALVLDDAEHRRFFDAAMRDHPMDRTDVDRLYAAQVVWDETMASTAARWLSHGHGPRQIVILAGAGHCHRSAIPRRIERRYSARTASVRLAAANAQEQRGLPPTSFDYDLTMAGPTEAPAPASEDPGMPAP